METHAEYHHNNPLPVCGVIFGRMAEVIEPPPIGVGRVVKHFMGEVNDYPKERKASPEKPKNRTRLQAIKARAKSCQATLDRQRVERYRRIMEGQPAMQAQEIGDRAGLFEGEPLTATAVRQVLNRLVASKHVKRTAFGHKKVVYQWNSKAAA